MYTISDETAEEDLPKQWELIIARLNEKTGWNLNAKGTASIDTVILKITAPKDDDPEKNAKVKKVWKTTMMCVDRLGVFVQRFGAFAAQGASMVFGPANQCFNAINFVITAAQQYKEVFAKITVLMERISVFLENLSMFMNNEKAEIKLDARLRKVVYRVLEHFVKIMGTTYDLTNSRRARLKLMASSFAFGEDDGIKDYLATLETLVSDFTGAQISVLVQDLSAAAKDIRGVDKKLDILGEAAEKQNALLDQLVVADASRSQQDKEKKDREAIKKALGINDSDKEWDRQTEFWDSHITGSGQWLLEKPYLLKWADKNATASEIITLKAPSGYGKSHLSSIVVRHLQDKYRADSRVVTAYYFLQRESSERVSVLNKITKSIVWQLARVNKEYTKLAANLCEGLDTSRTAHMWKRLITDVAKGADVTLFIVLDGIDVLENENDKSDIVDIIKQIRSLSHDEASHLKVRGFITGTREALDPISETLQSTQISIPEVHLEADPDSDEPSLNQVDLELFVGDRLDRNERLKGLDDQLKERLRRELAKGARGAYSRLHYLLDDLVNIQNTSQIENILKRANQSLSDIIADKVAALNNTLSTDEISELNTLLDWITVTSKYKDLSVAQCEIILSLKEDGQSLGLEDRIRRKYSDFFSLNDSKQITLRAGVTDHLEQANENTSTHVEVARRTADSIGAIQFGEVKLIERMLQNQFRAIFGDESIYTRFGFEEFFQSKLGDQAQRIRLVRAESCTRVAQGCLLAVCERANDDRSAAFLEYAYDWVIEHLEDVSPSETPPEIKQDMGRKLARLLQEMPLIDSWWSTRAYLDSYFVYRDYSRYLIKLIHKWLKDPGVQKGLTDMPTERQWVLQRTSGDSPSFTLYDNIAKFMAQRWFKHETDETARFVAFRFLCGWMRCMKDEIPEQSDLISTDQIRQIQSWAQDQLGNAELAGLWYDTLAATFRCYQYHKEAVVEYRHAVELLPTEWRIQVGLAASLGDDEQYSEAIATMTKLIDENKHLLGTNDDFTQKYWNVFLHDLGEWNTELENYDAAAQIYRQLLDHGLEQKTPAESTYKAIVNILGVLAKQARYNDAMDLIEQLSNKYDDENNDWAKLTFQQYSNIDDFHSRILAITKHSGTLSQISLKYELALYTGSLEGYQKARNMGFKYFFASLLWALGDREQQSDALEMWEEVVHHENLPGYEEHVSYLRTYAARNLAAALLSEGRRLELASTVNADAEAYFERLRNLSNVDFGESAEVTKSPRLLLARKHQLKGQSKEARDLVRAMLKDSFDLAATEGNTHAFYHVAVIFQAIDDDHNALAAWCNFVPTDGDSQNEAEGQGDGGTGDDVAVEKEEVSTDEGSSSTSDTSQETAPTEVASDEQATGGAEKSVDRDPSIENTSSNQAKPKLLEGDLGNFCDGLCGHTWPYADDIYACKDCLDVQFDAKCYKKLKAGELDVAICSKDHDHIHIPPFDEVAWRARPKGHIVVAGEHVPHSQWVENVKREWRIDEESLKISDNAARTIQRAWRSHEARQRASAWNALLRGAGVFPKLSPSTSRT